MDSQILKDIVIIFALSIVVLLACHRFKIPSIVGFLITGVLSGPQGLQFVGNTEDVATLAEIGIILLLFTVGLEFSLRKIFEYKRFFVVAGPIQVGLTTLAGFLVSQLIGRPVGESVFLGFLLSLSSTAIVLRTIQERLEMNTPHARLIFGMLIFQDIVVVPMMLFVPFLAGVGAGVDSNWIWLVFQGLLLLFVTLVCALKLFPVFLYHVAKTRSHELFLLTVLVICFSVAWVTSAIGLSLALGAFLAGLMISESEYGHEAVGRILPFQNVFTSFFFVSVGMLLDIGFFLQELPIILALCVGIIALKCLVVLSTALSIQVPLRPSIIAGVSLCQVGEFSFVLASAGMQVEIGTPYLYQLFLSVAVLSMGLTPAFMQFAPKLAQWLSSRPWSAKLAKFSKVESAGKTLRDHLIIIGYGFSGSNLARSSIEAKIPCVVLDLNAEKVRTERERGVPIFYGDGTHEHILNQVHIQEATALAVLVNDPVASLRIVEHARSLNHSIYIIVRTRYLEEMQALFQLGASDVVPDELGASVEIFTRVLNQYDIPPTQVMRLLSLLRSEAEQVAHGLYGEEGEVAEQSPFTEIAVKRYTVDDDSPLADQTVLESGLRKEFGLTIVLIHRNNDAIYPIEPQTKLKSGDRIVLLGSPFQLDRVKPLFHPSSAKSR